MKDLFLTTLQEGNAIIGDASHLLEIRRKAEHLSQMISSCSSVLYVKNVPDNLDFKARNDPEKPGLDFGSKKLKPLTQRSVE